MSWIKKLLTVFQYEDEEYEDEPEQQQAVKPRNKAEHSSKEMDARVLYQYPKGQFRFPLIPDEKLPAVKAKKERIDNIEHDVEVKPLTVEKGPLRRRHSSELGEEPVKRARGNANPKSNGESTRVRENRYVDSDTAGMPAPPMEMEQEKKHRLETKKGGGFKYRQDTKKTDGPKFRQPFKPTEIPSPIYAFNRPPVKPKPSKPLEAEHVEFELTGFDHSLVKEELHTQPIMDSKITHEEVTVTHAGEREDSHKGSAEAEIANHAILKDSFEDRSDCADSTVGLMEEKLPEGEGAIPIVNETSRQLEENINLAEPEEELQPDQTSGYDFQPEHEMNMGQELAGYHDGLPDSHAAGQVDELREAEEEAPIAPTAEIPGHHLSELDAETLQDRAGGGGASNPEPQEQEDAAPAQPRRQLPFNVLMLKQDKKKWQARQALATDGQAADDARSADSLIEEELNPIPASGNTSEDRQAAVISESRTLEEYEFPPLDLLNPPVFKEPDPQWLAEQEEMLNETLKNFNVGAKVVNMTQGPSVTRFELKPEPGVKVNKITNLSDDIKLSLAAKDIRIEAPIPGKHTIGIEVPNHSGRPVLLSEILQTVNFLEEESPLSVALGLDIEGKPIITDLKKMPHGLIAGATGSGKSVCINTMLVSLLYKAHPDDVKLLLIDPKMVELAPYNQIPHLVSPVITDVKAATASLKWAVEEMERRYELFAHTGVRDIGRFNELAVKHRRFADKLPYIVIVIDELADLMMMAPGDVEEAICRIAQKARACGIHLIIATQRPSVDVITGLIKANVPTRIAFSVSSQIDSRTIIDISGAEKLLGRGDMLFLENGSSKPFRLQGTFVTDSEIDDIVAFVRDQREPEYLFEQEELLRKAQVTEDEDELFYEACEFVVEQGGASTSSVQRRFKIGYNRAARLIEMMEQHGFISEGRGSKPRDVLISVSDLESFKETSAFH